VSWLLAGADWRRSESWPPDGARELHLHLDDAAAATRDAAGGTLRPDGAAESSVSWTHDPEQLVPSTVANPFAFLWECPDEQEVESRPDVATFTGGELTEPLDLAGPVTAHLRVATDGPSMHVFTKLVDVFPDGRAMMLLRGQAAVQGGGERPVEVYMSHTGYRVQPGHRLRLHVACSDFPLYVAHPGTDENPWFATETQANRQTLFTGGAEPSHLRLTVLDAG
jgi:uncharacterized protein